MGEDQALDELSAILARPEFHTATTQSWCVGRSLSFNAIRAKLLDAETGRKRPTAGYYGSR